MTKWKIRSFLMTFIFIKPTAGEKGTVVSLNESEDIPKEKWQTLQTFLWTLINSFTQLSTTEIQLQSTFFYVSSLTFAYKQEHFWVDTKSTKRLNTWSEWQLLTFERISWRMYSLIQLFYVRSFVLRLKTFFQFICELKSIWMVWMSYNSHKNLRKE